MKVVVVGAGVVGCASAWELARQGHAVTLVDAAPGPGTGASFANGGQLSYRFVEPLASPATLRALPRWLLDPRSPVRFRLRADPAQWAWGLRFLAACRGARCAAGTQALLALALRSRQVLEGWRATHALDFGFAASGKLVLCPDAGSLARQRALANLHASASAPQEMLSRAECVALEPALAAYEGFAGGVWTPSECVGDPFRYCQALVALLQAQGGRCRFGVPARGFVLRGGRAVALRTDAGELDADAFVLAAGLGSVALAGGLGERLPLYPVKGYSLTLDPRAGRALPRTSVTDLGRKMVLAPLGTQLRVAALAELTGADRSLPPRALAAIARDVETVYPGLCRFDELRPWAGLRPATPDSLPVLRRARVPNVVLNTGHGALGFTLAAGSAAVAAALLQVRPAAGVERSARVGVA